MLTGWGLPTVRVGQVVVNRQPGGIDKADASQVTRCSAVQTTTTTIQRGAWHPLQTTCHDASHWNSPLSCATLWSRRVHATVSGRIGRETAVDGMAAYQQTLPAVASVLGQLASACQRWKRVRLACHPHDAVRHRAACHAPRGKRTHHWGRACLAIGKHGLIWLACVRLSVQPPAPRPRHHQACVARPATHSRHAGTLAGELVLYSTGLAWADSVHLPSEQRQRGAGRRST